MGIYYCLKLLHVIVVRYFSVHLLVDIYDEVAGVSFLQARLIVSYPD